MATTNTISQQLLDLLATRNFHPEMLDRMGRPSNAEDAKTFTFDYISGAGKNYGTMVIVLDSDNEMKIMYGDNLGRTMEGDDKSEFFDFLQHLNQKATSNRWTHSISDINQLKHTMQGMAAIQEGLFEGYYGTRKVSYAGEPTQARLQIVHSQPLGEGDARYRYIDRMFIETAEGEKFKLGFKSLSGARAMLEHVRQGGKPYDIRGCHITETVNEIAVLSRFNRASANRILEGVTQELVTEAQAYYQTLRENLKHMATGRGYAKYFESWHPATINEQEGVVDNIKTLFIEQSIDSRIEAALPLLAKIQQRGHEMKEADIFENWINNLAEGTWTLPETPEQLDKLKTLMTKELIVGPDATNATEQLYDLVGDDELFDRLHALADQDPRANCWNDTEVMNRLAELGIELPEPSAPGNPAEPETGATAPVAASVAPNPAPQQPVAEGNMDGKVADIKGRIAELEAEQERNEFGSYAYDTVDGELQYLYAKLDKAEKGVAEGDNLATFESTLDTMRKAAGVPILKAALLSAGGAAFDKFTESRLMDSAGETLEHILNRFKHEVKNFEANGDLDDDLYHALYDYYSDNGEMPYGTMKARTGDPYNWISDRLADELGVAESNSGMIMPEADVLNTFEVMSGFDVPAVHEGSCNMTMEGEYCPEHGLAECGGMYETMDEAMFPGSAIGDKLRGMKSAIGQTAGDALKGAMIVAPGAGAGASAGAALGAGAGSALFAPALGAGALGGAAAALGGFLTYKGLNYLAQKLFGTKEEALAFADAHLKAAGSEQPQFEFQGKTYPVKINSPQEAQQLLGKIRDLQSQLGEDQVFDKPKHDDPMNYNAAITGSYYESREGDAALARIKSLALLK